MRGESFENAIRRIRGGIAAMVDEAPEYIIHNGRGDVLDIFYSEEKALKKFKCYSCIEDGDVYLYKRYREEE